MKKYIFYTILSFLIATSASARKTGCEGNCENGFGKWTYTDKTTYEGNWVGTQKHGQGILTFPDGSTYEGEWANGFMNGKGKFTWSDGKEKIGIWKNGKLQE